MNVTNPNMLSCFCILPGKRWRLLVNTWSCETDTNNRSSIYKIRSYNYCQTPLCWISDAVYVVSYLQKSWTLSSNFFSGLKLCERVSCTFCKPRNGGLCFFGSFAFCICFVFINFISTLSVCNLWFSQAATVLVFFFSLSKDYMLKMVSSSAATMRRSQIIG